MTEWTACSIARPTLLAESPVWLVNGQYDGHIVFIDIQRGEIHLGNAVGEPVAQWSLFARCGRIGALVPCRSGRWLLVSDAGVVIFDPATDTLSPPIFPRPENSDLRFNDAKSDPRGRLWCGTISLSRTRGAASLYRGDANRLTPVLGSMTNSNGLAWSRDEKTLYHIDTPTREIAAYNYSVESGELDPSSRRVAIAFADGVDRPDGMTIASDGTVFVAHYAGGCISRWDVTQNDTAHGIMLERYSLPPQLSPRVTSCTFGGDDLRTLFVTVTDVGLFRCRIESLPPGTPPDLFDDTRYDTH